MAVRPFNFSAGPAAMPAEVLTQAADEMLDWSDASGRRSGMGVMEMSHRGREFGEILARAQADFRKLMAVPAHFHILFMQGGGAAQNAIVPLNLCGPSAQNQAKADFVVASCHWGLWEDVLEYMREIAHAAIDAGADIVAGHGSHTALGVEIYKGRTIFYSLGGLIFQNETLPFVPAEAYERFDLGPDATPSNLFDARTKHDTKGFPAYAGYWECFVPVCHFKQGQLASIDIIPTDLGYGQPRHRRGRAMWADGAQAAKILSRVTALSKDLGTRVEISGGVGRIEL